MAIARIGPKHQITIPREAFDELGLQPGDLLQVEVAAGGLHLVPQKLIPRDQAWFWTDGGATAGGLRARLRALQRGHRQTHLQPLWRGTPGGRCDRHPLA